ncbi:iron complex outermembrane recepter protein [Gammaproteobacteria bacterium]
MKRIFTFWYLAMAIVSGTACADDTASAISLGQSIDPNEVSLEDLMRVEVTSVSKKPQRLANVPAAVQVISAEDIQLSGARSLPEVLRLSPGIDATRLSGDRWEVSTRGFAEYFATKFLVLVDGRNAFNPAFAGMIWQDFQFPLEDIERIEVIRGPAAAIWGTNGMNGVISIITKSAASTQGGQAVIGGGRVEGSFGRMRWGGRNAAGDLFYRIYGAVQHANSQDAIDGGDGHDAYANEAAGFRVDHYPSSGARWDLSGDVFSNQGDDVSYAFTMAGVAKLQQTEKHRGATLRIRYEKTGIDGSNLQIQGAYANTNLCIPFLMNGDRNTFDFDLQHRFQLSKHQELVWGFNYRLTNDTFSASPVLSLNTPSRRLSYLGIFTQNEITLADTVRLTLGLRLDHNDISGWDSQPTARLSWNIQPNHTLWGALSQAARAPSRTDSGFNFNLDYKLNNPGPNVNTLVILNGIENPGSERLKAGEVGLRSQWTPKFASDLVVFSHHYDNLLRTLGEKTIDLSNFPSLIIVQIPIMNGSKMTLNGIELAADWRITPSWHTQLAQTWNQVTHATNTGEPSGSIPESISSLRVSWLLKKNINMDMWLRHIGGRPGTDSMPQMMRNGFSSLDLRWAWQPTKTVELSIVGQNLNNGACDAYAGLVDVRSNINIIPTCQPRSLIGQLRFNF